MTAPVDQAWIVPIFGRLNDDGRVMIARDLDVHPRWVATDIADPGEHDAVNRLAHACLDLDSRLSGMEAFRVATLLLRDLRDWRAHMEAIT